MQKDEFALRSCQFGFWQVIFPYYPFSKQMKVLEVNGNIQKIYPTTMT